MKRLIFQQGADPDTALLIKESEVYLANKIKLGIHYFAPMAKILGAKVSKRTCAIGTYHPSDSKLKKKDLKVFAAEIMEYCDTNGITTLLVADGDYFKYLAGVKAVEKHIGEKFECVLEGYGHITVLPMVNYQAVLMFPEKQVLLDRCNKVAAQQMDGNFIDKDAFEFESYHLLDTPFQVKTELEVISKLPLLACDIETTGLPVGPTELLTIAFATDDHNAIAFPIHPQYGFEDAKIKGNLKNFFNNYKGKLIFHNGLYDVKHLVYNLYMKDFSDIAGMIEGVNALKFHDTMIMEYIMVNSTAHPKLGLKELTYDFLGDYGEDVEHAIDIPLEQLARYNGKDVCGTFHVFNNRKQVLTYPIYTDIMEPSYKPLLKMMLNGMPIVPKKVDEVGKILQKDLDEAEDVLAHNDHVKVAMQRIRQKAADQYNEAHVVKQKQPGEFMDLQFNPNSDAQLRILLFGVMNFVATEKTDTGMDSTKRSCIEEFARFADADMKPTLEALIKISQAGIILTTFINAFKELSITQNEQTTLHGNLKLAGTQSGRLSSNSPNMQNLPSNSKFGKAVKSCFVAPKGYLFAGADFNALEDRIGAILSKDPNKLKEVLGGFDGHSLRCYAFFPEELEAAGLGDLDPEDFESINRIKDELPDLRQKAKPISFLKQYGGGAGKIQKVLKCSATRAKQISDAYDRLYIATLRFNAKNNEFARGHGYVECAFGLRLKTPRINSRDSGTKSSEERSSNNAVTQSWGMLTSRATNEFDDRIEKDEMSEDVILINNIHDAIYMLIKDDPKVVKWVNDNLIECMEWQDHPALESEIRMHAELDFGPSWDKQYTLKNGMSLKEIKQQMKEVL